MPPLEIEIVTAEFDDGWVATVTVRKPKEATLRSFDIEVIARYVPEYPPEIATALDKG